MKYSIFICALLCSFSHISFASLTTPFRACADLTTNQQGCWELDEASGSAIDSSANSNDLTDNNTVTADEDDYWAETSEGSRDFELSNSESLSITDASQTGLDIVSSFTTAAWLKIESTGTVQHLFNKRESSLGYSIQLTSSNQLAFEIDGDAILNDGTTISIDKWVHTAVVYDTTDNVVIFYQNGNVTSIQAATNDPGDNSSEFTLGANTSPADFYDGLMKDALVASDVKTPLEIKSLALGLDLANDAFRPDDSSLTAPTSYWKLNEISAGTGAITRVDSVGSNDLTDLNTVTTAEGYIEGASADFETSNTERLTITDASQTGLDFTGDFTLVTWIKNEGTTLCGAGAHFIQKNGDTAYAFILANNGANVSLQINGSTAVTSTNSILAENDVWIHLAAVYNGTTAKIYVDGVEDASAAFTTDPVGNSDEFSLGADINDGCAIDALMSDAAVWNGTALASTDIEKIAAGLPIQQSGIVSFWNLDEESSTRVDSIGSNDLTDNNTVLFGAGQVSNAADFESTNSESLSITDASQTGLEPSSAFTILAWYKPESLVTGTLIDKFDGANGYKFRVAGAVTVLNTAGAATNAVSSLVAGTFTHLGAVWDGSTQRIYFDSKDDASSSSSGLNLNTTIDFLIGAQTESGPTNFADGLMDEALFAERYFREEEIKACYNKGLTGNECISASVEAAAPTRNRLIMVLQGG